MCLTLRFTTQSDMLKQFFVVWDCLALLESRTHRFLYCEISNSHQAIQSLLNNLQNSRQI